ncbi:3'-5' DNA helicase [Tulasnella sp. 330]|nr:3'-5' DNA helicase [Tulasnella sp. 330]
MSSDGYDFEMDFDSGYLDQVDQIAASHFSSATATSSTPTLQTLPTKGTLKQHSSTRRISNSQQGKFCPTKQPSFSFIRDNLSSSTSTSASESRAAPPSGFHSCFANVPEVIEIDDDDDDFGALDEDDLAGILDVETLFNKDPQAFKRPTTTIQTTLDGLIVEESEAGPSRAPSNVFGRQAAKVKTWDRTAFAETGFRANVGQGKGKKKRRGEEDREDDHEETIEFEQFPAPFVYHELARFTENFPIHPLLLVRPAPPMKLKVDKDAVREWVFPLNRAKRDYQYNIIRNSLFENSLIALPTGLGKTFIAGVIMMNYYRWFPNGKVLFVAPTKPLVAQQIEACRETCGIPPSESVEMTGKIPKTMRIKHWDRKRVFFMTPQTLYNDIASEAFDPLDVVLLVIDEAHRATGDYAYSTVVRYLTAKNPHFRLLALTATPGSDPERVQNVIDNLHISHIEIRDEKSLDLRQYVHEKKVIQTIVSIEGEIEMIRDLLAKVMEKDAKKLSQSNIMHVSDVTTLHPFRCTKARQELRNRPEAQANKWAWSTLTTMGVLARAMGYLLEQSTTMCYKVLKDYTLGVEVDPELEEAFGGAKKKKAEPKKPNQLLANPDFKRLMGELENQRTAHGGRFPSHPKVDKLLAVLLEHFRAAERSSNTSTRVMVFVTFRDCVDEIVELLNGHGPILRATRFVGQGTDKSGKKGIAQKDQIEVIRQFKADKYNVLVATSIGEEGLDIGEVDLIVCYDSQKTPIRMLQRIGRTGRMRNGRIEIFSTQGREEENYNKAQISYKEIQRSIIRGEALELFADVPRLIPDDIKPKCVEKVVEIPSAEDSVEAKGRGKGKRKAKCDVIDDDDGDEDGDKDARPVKKKRKSAVEVPPGAVSGFVTANNLIVKTSSKSKLATTSAFDVPALEDDTEDELIEKVLQEPELKPTLKTKSKSKAQPKSKLKQKQLTTAWNITADDDDDMDGLLTTTKATAGSSKPAKLKSKAKPSSSSAKPKSTSGGFTSAKNLAMEAFQSMKEDDRMDVDRGNDFEDDHAMDAVSPPSIPRKNAGRKHRSDSREPPRSKAKASTPAPLRSSLKVNKVATPIVISSSSDDETLESKSKPHSKSKPQQVERNTIAKAKADKLHSTTAAQRTTTATSLLAELTMSSPPPPAPVRPIIKGSKPKPISNQHSWLLEDGSDDLPADAASAPMQEGERDEFDMAMDDSFSFDEWPPTPALDGKKEIAKTQGMGLGGTPRSAQGGTIVSTRPTARSVRQSLIESPDARMRGAVPRKVREEMPPPSALPLHMSSPVIDLSFPVRGPSRPRFRAAKRDVDVDMDTTGVPSSPGGHAGPSSLATHVTGNRSKAPPKVKRQKALLSRIGNAMFAMEADHSGDEISVGGSDVSDENEYDRSFVTDGDPTQAPEDYDQEAIYRQGLMTQAPAGLAFHSGPVRKGQYTGGASEMVRERERRRRRDIETCSSPGARSSEPDEYELDSFVVEDNDEILELSSER